MRCDSRAGASTFSDPEIHHSALIDRAIANVQLVWLHAPTRLAHDHIANQSGDFDAACESLRRAVAEHHDVAAATALVRSNTLLLDQLADTICSLRVRQWFVCVPTSRDVPDGRRARTLPRLAIAVPYALRAIDIATRRGTTAQIVDAPLCLLGPLASRSLRVDRREFASVCERCSARADCPGIDAWYLDRFGGDELRPR